jgi:hypothetical protein
VRDRGITKSGTGGYLRVLGATDVCLFGGGGGGGAEVGVQRSDGYGSRARPARQSRQHVSRA